MLNEEIFKQFIEVMESIRYRLSLIAVALFIIIGFILIGCAQEKTKDEYEDKIISWQDREDSIHKGDPYVYWEGEEVTRSISYTGDFFIDLINGINRLPYIRYESDESRVDYWQTYRETLERLAGDCEDMAITAYCELIRNDFLKKYPLAEILITIIDQPGRSDHAVLSIYNEGERYVIDGFMVYEYYEFEHPILVQFDISSIFWEGKYDEEYGKHQSKILKKGDLKNVE